MKTLKTCRIRGTVAAALFVAMGLSATTNAQLITSFVNLDFDAGVANVASGFDNPGADIPGWRDYTAMTDSGVEGPGAWWGPYDQYAAWMKSGEAAYNLSDYTIQAGDAFSIAFMAQWWQWTGANGQWTATLFYDNPANVIGSYTTPDLNPHTQWTAYTTATPIAATAGSVGGKLGILMASTGSGIAQVDEITVAIPEPATISLVAVAGLGLLLRRRQPVK